MNVPLVGLLRVKAKVLQAFSNAKRADVISADVAVSPFVLISLALAYAGAKVVKLVVWFKPLPIRLPFL